ncbi:hypothetical protein [Sorangium sp. So ce1078]|uniref:hypothetical protein n=1 Tax=Sorangium sp. So ce1078 TaxID=3133329 RepID=UPI003F63B1A6
MINRRNIHTGLKMALLTALVGGMSSACVEAGDPSVDEEPIREVEQAYGKDGKDVKDWTTVPCSMLAAVPTGRQWATLAISGDMSICYLSPDTAQTLPPPANALDCHDIGRSLKCARVVDLY